MQQNQESLIVTQLLSSKKNPKKFAKESNARIAIMIPNEGMC